MVLVQKYNIISKKKLFAFEEHAHDFKIEVWIQKSTYSAEAVDELEVELQKKFVNYYLIN